MKKTKTLIKPQELITINAEVKHLTTKISSTTIKDETSFIEVSKLYSQAKDLYKKIYEERKAATKDLEQQIKELELPYLPTEKSLKALIDQVKEDIITYQNRVIAERELKEKQIADRIGSGKGKIGLETALNQISTLSEPLTNIGSLSFTNKPTLNITDLSKIPDLYWRIDEDSILRDLKLGHIIPGAEIKIIKIPRNSSK